MTRGSMRDLTAVERDILAELARLELASAAELTPRTPRYLITDALYRFSRLGLVERSLLPGAMRRSSRRYAYRLTAAGRAALGRGAAWAQEGCGAS